MGGTGRTSDITSGSQGSQGVAQRPDTSRSKDSLDAQSSLKGTDSSQSLSKQLAKPLSLQDVKAEAAKLQGGITPVDPLANLKKISQQDAIDKKMFGPTFHGTTTDLSQKINEEGFKVFEGEAQTGDIRHGYEDTQYGSTGIPAPVHHLGYGVYLTTVKDIAKQYNQGSGKGLNPYYIDAPRLETINFGSPNTMMKWWIKNGYDPELAKKDRVAATKKMTETLKSKYDAVYFKGKGIHRLLDGDQIVVFDPNRIHVIDSTLTKPGEIGAKVIRKVDGMKGVIVKKESLEGILEQFPGAASWIKPDAKSRYWVKWKRGGTDMNVQDVEVDLEQPKGSAKGSSITDPQNKELETTRTPKSLDEIKREAEAVRNRKPVHVTDPNGHVHGFPDEKSAASFRTAAGITE